MTMNTDPNAPISFTDTVPDDQKQKKNKKKKKYSRFARGPQKTEEAIVKGVHRMARAVEEGLSNWRASNKKSSKKKRDGAVKDAIKNFGKATSKIGREAAKVPADVAKMMPNLTKSFR